MQRGKLCNQGLHDDWCVPKNNHPYCRLCKAIYSSQRVRKKRVRKVQVRKKRKEYKLPRMEQYRELTNNKWFELEQKLEVFLYGTTTEVASGPKQ
jgi:hypothetical protein